LAGVADVAGGAKGTPRRRVFPVGRLDYATSGLILLTDDGGFAYRASHPKFGVEKAYAVVCVGPVDAEAAGRLRDGVDLGDGRRTAPARVYPDGRDPTKLTVVLHEGRNRQIRRMVEAVGNTVTSLERVAIGGLRAPGLAPGEWRVIAPDEAGAVFAPYIHDACQT
ncbi:MAG: pseudouridine synthase, partial [Oscillospiraceae bacterium]|nr:pseudouridine synthase [Oscillospiraceae bacterium]